VPFYLVNFAQALLPGAEVAPLANATDSLAREPKTPWLVTATIRQRITRLPSEAQETLAVAAIIGRVAPLDTLRLALNCPEDDLTDPLETACRAHLLEEAGTDPIAYRFTHDLIRETLLDSLGQARQALAHRNVANALEQLPASEQARQAAALADHLTKAGELARALPYALQAGAQAEAVYAHSEAAERYGDALALAQAFGDRAREAEAMEKRSRALWQGGRLDEARDLVEHAALPVSGRCWG
jgi:predicted ATPase